MGCDKKYNKNLQWKPNDNMLTDYKKATKFCILKRTHV